jgi:hypothetical protein
LKSRSGGRIRPPPNGNFDGARLCEASAFEECCRTAQFSPLPWHFFTRAPNFKLEYHVFVRHSTSASVALASFALLALSSFFLATSHAQVNGTTTSITSHGFGGSHPITAPFPAGGTLPGHSVPHSTSHPGDSEHHHHHYVQYQPPLIYAIPYPVPYAVDIGDAEDDSDPGAANNSNDDSDANYQGGPTIFDRRGNGADSYIPPRANATAPEFLARADSAPPEPAAPAPTLLVFKDGHTLEVGNYAIIGATLFDLTPGHSRKVPLADLNLQSTQRQNDTRGITFQLPPQPAQAN